MAYYNLRDKEGLLFFLPKNIWSKIFDTFVNISWHRTSPSLKKSENAMECNEEQLHPAVSSTIWNIRPPSSSPSAIAGKWPE